MLNRDHLPAYISWERFCANQQRLDANRTSKEAAGAAAAGAGAAGWLAPLRPVRPTACRSRYGGPKGASLVRLRGQASDYGEPLCQSLSGQVLDDLVAEQVLAAVEPAALEASLAAVADIERERAELLRQWSLRIESVRL